MRTRKDVRYVRSHALEFCWIRLSLVNGTARKVVYNNYSKALEFGWVRLPRANGNDERCLQHLESSIEVRLFKIQALLTGIRKDVCNI